MRSSQDSQDPTGCGIEAQAHDLLARYVENMPSGASVEQRVRERLTPQKTKPFAGFWATLGVQRLAGEWARGAVSLGILVALLAGFAAVTHWRGGAKPNTGPWMGAIKPCATLNANGSITLCASGSIVASVTVVQAYADVTRTAVELRITTVGSSISPSAGSAALDPSRALIEEDSLTDSQGRVYTQATGLPFGFNYSGSGEVATGYSEFDPLPESALGAAAPLTLHISGLALIYSPPSGGEYALHVDGPLETSFTVMPQAGRSVNFQVAPETHHGITVQPIRLDVGPSDTVFDDLGGGERLILRVSGLPATTKLAALAAMTSSVSHADGSGGSAEHESTLTLEHQFPATVAGGYLSPESSKDPVVGPSGTVDLEIIFLSPPLSSLVGTQPLTLNQITVSITPTPQSIQGPWTFSLPLS